tara:strand:+ start:389 stop:583 length:195 start_codon:yes stop_codon:yes gene_type:complete
VIKHTNESFSIEELNDLTVPKGTEVQVIDIVKRTAARSGIAVIVRFQAYVGTIVETPIDIGFLT